MESEQTDSKRMPVVWCITFVVECVSEMSHSSLDPKSGFGLS